MNSKEQYAADLQAAIDRQTKRNPKATISMINNIKAVEHETYLNKNSNRYSR